VVWTGETRKEKELGYDRKCNGLPRMAEEAVCLIQAGGAALAAVTFGELPKTATGKIQELQLRETEWEGQKRRVG
jgi:acyl-coenzyme A synthetase/AMP-(fatty) acid ligase